MPQLGERDLALLSSVIYCDEVVKGEEINLQRLAREMLEPDYVWDKVELCGDFGHIAKELGREAAVERFKEVLVEIRNSPQLQHIEIASPIHDLSRDGITAACFVDMRDNAVSAVFAGRTVPIKNGWIILKAGRCKAHTYAANGGKLHKRSAG